MEYIMALCRPQRKHLKRLPCVSRDKEIKRTKKTEDQLRQMQPQGNEGESLFRDPEETRQRKKEEGGRNKWLSFASFHYLIPLLLRGKSRLIEIKHLEC